MKTVFWRCGRSMSFEWGRSFQVNLTTYLVWPQISHKDISLGKADGHWAKAYVLGPYTLERPRSR